MFKNVQMFKKLKFSKNSNFQKIQIFKKFKFSKISNFQKFQIFKNFKCSKSSNFQKVKIFKKAQIFTKSLPFEKVQTPKNSKPVQPFVFA